MSFFFMWGDRVVTRPAAVLIILIVLTRTHNFFENNGKNTTHFSKNFFRDLKNDIVIVKQKLSCNAIFFLSKPKQKKWIVFK
jgi:hypothetical protein